MFPNDSVFPSNFSALQALNRRLGTLTLEAGEYRPGEAPEDILVILKSVPVTRGLLEISDRIWRRLPLAITGEPGNCILEYKEICEAYWQEKLLNVPRGRLRRWLRPLVYSYLQKFDSSSSQFRTFYAPIISLLDRSNDLLSSGLNLLKNIGVFSIDRGPTAFCEHLISSSQSIDEFCESQNLWSDFPSTNFAISSFRALGSLNQKLLRSPLATKNLLSWCGAPRKPRYPALTRTTAENILLPWEDSMPTQAQLFALRSFILENPYLGNPDRQNPNWTGINSSCKEVFKKWMIGQSLDAFFEVLQNTADEIWKYRERFWRTYFSLGAIEDIWLVLGRDAERFILTNRAKYGHLSFGTFYDGSGGVSRNHSLLIIRIGDIEFAEWSHNGSLRARPIQQNGLLYKPNKCNGDDYKYDSMDFHDGMNERNQLAHHGSSTGGWQDKARRFIRKNTGINAQLADVCI